MILNINPGGSGEPELLWTNPNPTAEFGSQTVYINLAAYQGVLIKFRDSDTVSRYIYVPKAAITSDNCPVVADPGEQFWYTRSASVRCVTSISDSGITFANALNIYEAEYDNNLLKPLAIYGVKWTI